MNQKINKTIIGLLYLFLINFSSAQTFISSDPFKSHYFIENKGQYPDFQNQKVLFELTDKSNKIYILQNGFLWTKGYKDSSTEKNQIKICWIKNQFLNTNNFCSIKKLNQSKHYFSFGQKSLHSFGYQKLIFENFYPNIDLIYELGNNGDGFKYSFKVKSGGDIGKIQYSYSSENTTTIDNSNSEIAVKSSFFQLNENNLTVFNGSSKKLESSYRIKNNIISYHIPQFKIGNAITIDPWVNAVTVLTRKVNFFSDSYGENIGFDVDFDSKGNVYVWGGCSIGMNQMHLAKYDMNGNLKWVFPGVTYVPVHGLMWYSTRFFNLMGNFIVDRAVDKIYLSDGWGTPANGNFFVRLDSNGNSDSFLIHHPGMTTANKMLVRCDPHRVVAFGGFNHTNRWSNIFELLDTNIYKPKAFTKKKSPQYEMIIDAVIDDSNKIFLLLKAYSPPYNYAPGNKNNVDVLVKLSDSMTSSIFYDTLPTKVDQYTMKPFVRGPYSSVGYLGTSVNSLSATKNYIYYYDGKFIAAYYKTNGNLAKLDSLVGKTQNFQQGIVADNCGNVIVGGDSGRIKVYYFNGTNFQLKKQITIFPNSKRCVLDLAYDKDRNLIVFSGDSMAGTIINPVNCESSKATEFYVYPNKRCSNFAFAQVKFADTTKSYTFTWYDSTTNKVIRKITKYKQFRDTLYNRISNHNYLVSIKQEDGCYSFVSNFWLYAIPAYDTTINITLCEGQSFKHKNKFYTGDTNTVDTFITFFGCDSFVRYSIITNKHSAFYQNKNICKGETFKVGTHFHFNTGVFHDTLINSKGCDSVVHTTLFVSRDSIFQFIRLCDNSNYKIGKHIYTASGTYIDSFKNFLGCDSIVTTKLIISKDTLIQQSFKICKGNKIQVGSNSYVTSGVYIDSFKQISGCDSIIKTNLIVYSDTSIFQKFNICKGDSIKVGTHFYNQSDNYVDTLKRTTGCDSIIYTKLFVLKTNDTMNQILLCNKDSVFINGKFYNQTTKFVTTYKNSNGCDSTVTYNIIKNKILANFEIDSTQNPIFVFKNLSQGNVKYYWNFGDLSVDSINKNTSHQYKNDDTYWANVCLTIIDSFGCNDTICQKIQISKLLYFLFNGFTPGKDGKNDNLKIQYKGGTFNYNLLVYNRWGALVFETLNANVSDESKFWNGNVMNTGPECPSGSYFAIYQLYLNGTNNPPKEIHSVITLLREF